jgi:hypothetical protein
VDTTGAGDGFIGGVMYGKDNQFPLLVYSSLTSKLAVCQSCLLSTDNLLICNSCLHVSHDTSINNM